jgi:hypothetical protein
MSKLFTPYPLGRRRQADSRDELYPVRALLRKHLPLITHKTWDISGAWLNQGDSSACVGHGWAHVLADGPLRQYKQGEPHVPILDPFWIYDEARKVDAFPGEDYDGTTVRAGADVLLKNGFISAYHWAYDLETLVDAVLHLGPVVVGTTWYEQMFYPEHGWLKVDGSAAGGHCWKIYYVNTQARYFGMKNSWGRDWGIKGTAKIAFDDMDTLIKDDGEICIAKEIKNVTA